jgi:hypothetical protein
MRYSLVTDGGDSSQIFRAAASMLDKPSQITDKGCFPALLLDMLLINNQRTKQHITDFEPGIRTEFIAVGGKILLIWV